MLRQIFLVNAMVVDANGNMSVLSGYPKSFDSKNYDNDIDKTYRRADGEASKVWSDMCKIDTRQQQTVTLETTDGFQLYSKTTGALAEIPDPEPEPEPDPDPEPEPEG